MHDEFYRPLLIGIAMQRGIRIVPEGTWLLEQVLADRASVA
jgi:hypothetical protein